MNPNIIYFSAYAAIIDEKFYEAEWIRINEIITTKHLGDEVKNEVMKIFGDDDNKIPFNNVLCGLKNMPADDKRKAISLALVIAMCDGYLCKKENEFIKGVAYSIGVDDYNQIKMQMQSLVESDGDFCFKAPKGCDITVYKFLKDLMPGSLKEMHEGQSKKCLLAGDDYSKAIADMRAIAQTDIQYAREAFDAMSDKMKEASLKLQKSTNVVQDSANNATVNDNLTCNDSLKSFLFELCSKNAQYINEIRDMAAASLTKKEDASRHYTISFLGRTKAGKSTLHSIMLGGNGREFIGVGKERTTRYNRVYQWNGIRIIDTPGTSAPGGEHDKEIASEIIDETDLLCLMVSSDGIQESEFKFLQGIKDQNKPVLVILNKKENIERSPRKIEMFLNNPLDWYYRKGEDDINGHIDRIRGYTTKYYNNSNVDICPMQLLAAKLSQDCTDKSKKEKLYDGSRLQFFLDDIRTCIMDFGTLKRSQTILDGTIFHFSKYKNDFSNQIDTLLDIECTIQHNSTTATDKIRNAGLKAKNNIKHGIEAVFDTFIKNDLQRFAITYYKLDNDEVDEKLSKFVKEYDFGSKIKYVCETELEIYKTEVENILTTFNENLDFDIGKLEFDEIDLSGTFDTRSLISFLGGLVVLAGGFISGPIGFVASIVGVGIALLSNIFKPKREKIKEAQDKLYSNLKKQFENHKKNMVSKMTREVEKSFDALEIKVKGIFESIFDKIENVTSVLEELNVEASFHFNELNKIYAARILNFVAGKDIFKMHDEFGYRELEVSREFGKYMKIQYPEVGELDTEEITKVLQEKITINENKQ